MKHAGSLSTLTPVVMFLSAIVQHSVTLVSAVSVLLTTSCFVPFVTYDLDRGNHG